MGLGFLVMVSVGVVSAHAEYKSSVPAASTSAGSAAGSVTVTFTEELSSVTIAVKGPDGSTVSTGAASIDLANRTNASVPIRAAMT